MSPSALARALAAPGRAAIPFVDAAGNPDRPLTLHAYRPAGYTPDRPVVIVQHGMLRNGDEYRDFWIPSADRFGVLVVAPTYSNEAYPESESYNNGLVFDQDGAVRPRAAWGYAAIGRIARLLRESGVTTRERVRLFGHSAGGQFVHRLLGVEDHGFIESAIAGNPGWYSLPTLERAFPEGFGGIGIGAEAIARMLAFPLVILAGDQDVATNEPSLPSGEAALRQGPHRFARAHHFFEFGRREAEARGLPFGWRLQVVPGIGHDGAAMSAVAAHLWFAGEMPGADLLAELAGRRAA